jgi:hypothetical protein
MILSTCIRVVMGVAAFIVLGAAFMHDANAQRQCPSTYDHNTHGRTEFKPDGAYIKSPTLIFLACAKRNDGRTCINREWSCNSDDQCCGSDVCRTAGDNDSNTKFCERK